MKLKEAYRYSNCLDTMCNSLIYYLSQDGVVTKTVEEHMKSKADPDAQDETVEVPKTISLDADVNRIIDLMAQIVDERDKVTKAINKAKADAEIDIDQALSMNKWERNIIKTLEHLAHLKSTENIIRDTGYKLDAEGKQTAYVYNKKVVRTIDYDRNKVRNLLHKYQTQCDEASSKVEQIEINTEVDFEPKFDIHTSLEDLLSEDS